MTLSAQFFTFPLLLYNFGQISIVAIIANILVVPILPFLMLLSFFTGIIGIVTQQLSFIAVFPTWFFTTYLVKIAEFTASLPFAALRLDSMPFLFVLIAYILLGFLTWIIHWPEPKFL